MKHSVEELEDKCSDSLVNAWNAFIKCKPKNNDEITDFRRAIHECQRILAIRTIRRLQPKKWTAEPKS